jgi:hypothetical protein
MTSFARLRDESNRVAVDFLLAELDTAFVFLELSDTTSSAETRVRTRKNAYIAYETALRLSPRVTLMDSQKIGYEERLAQLKKRLEELGFDV